MNKKLILIASFTATIFTAGIRSEDTDKVIPEATSSILPESKKPELQSKDLLSKGLKSLGNPALLVVMLLSPIFGPGKTIGAIILVGAATHHETLIPMLQNWKNDWKASTINHHF